MSMSFPRASSQLDVKHPPMGPILRRFLIDPHLLPLGSKTTVMDESLIAFITKYYFVKKLLTLLSFDRTLSR